MFKFLTVFLGLFFTVHAHSQITSAEIKGNVKDASGESIPGVQVMVKHIPTGQIINVRTDVNGIFFLSNLKPGGPYEVNFKLSSYQESFD